MARSFPLVVLIVSALCFTSVLAVHKTRMTTDKAEVFIVLGKIYCDPCQFEFQTRLSKPLSDVKVILSCRKEEGNNVTFMKEAMTNKNGSYIIEVDGEHEEEICEVYADSNGGECSLPMANKSYRVGLTKHIGVSSLVRYINPLGFMTKSIDSQCESVVSELHLNQLDN